jgi:YidC/Oxa1 family membrane protein insertase
VFQAAGWLISTFYAWTHNYATAIALVAVVIMMLVLPLTLKSTKGMLEMQRLQPEMRRLQQQHRGDRQTLNEEMMKLYQEHKVNPLASCLPLLVQMPVFFIMFRVLHGLTRRGEDGTFDPQYISTSSELYKSLDNSTEMLSFGLDLALRPADVIRDDPAKGLIYAGLVLLLGLLYFVQQRMVASRTTSATMSPAQQKLMQYLPVFFAVFQLFFPVGLVIYYLSQTIIRIGQQAYITKRFYAGEHSLGKQAQAAGATARDMAKSDGGGGGLLAQLRQDTGSNAKSSNGKSTNGKSTNGKSSKPAPTARPVPPSKRVTPPKNKPTPRKPTPPKGRPTPSNRPSRPSRPPRPSAPPKD